MSMNAPKPRPDTPVYDATNVCPIPGASNFTADNAYAALRAARILSRDSLHAKLNVTVYDHLNANNELYFDRQGDKVMWREFTVTIDPESDCTSAVVTSELSDGKGKKVLIRTREF